ncbi:uncharacterized protein MELLADRAFT_58601 [Melampsora larici-populina 98AG31]|uniref:Secreted protein n=1 Tax=Melampsora larici-populina (strain 98AG31 / pathotype 3-4-7) TaxID=747676 RepID=F4R457_MELLP|nr:uncharacterized protein MELLADRAFT_58601 [Melampsora larici-populina 98AG31]EGG12745.1 hypothetical protein MELLADRAFT_58601 [Melampsora larici-populina 98AG31]
MKMRPSSAILLSSLILIFVTSLLSLPLENELDEALLADKVYSHGPDADPRSAQDPRKSSSSSLVPKKTSLQKGTRKTKFLEQFWKAALDPPPESASEENWKIYYKIALKVLYLNDLNPKIKALAEAVTELGESFPLLEYTDQGIDAFMVPYLYLAHSCLRVVSLGLGERIWVVGVLSCLRWKIPKQKEEIKSNKFIYTSDIATIRGNIETFLLREQPLGEILQTMWPDFLTYSSLADQHPVVWEGLQRASLANLILQQIRTSAIIPSDEFKGIMKSFLRLQTPIDDYRASTFTDDLAGQLVKMLSSTRPTSALAEETALVRILLHMQENHLHSRLKVLQLIREHKIGKIVFRVDIGLQLGDNPLDSPANRLYSLLKNVQNLNIEDFNDALKSMIDQELPIPQWGKLLRILEVSKPLNRDIYNSVDALLSDSEGITGKLARVLHQLYPRRGNRNIFSPPGILALISTRAQDLKEAIHRQELEKKLVFEGILSAQVIEPFSKFLMWNFKGDRKPELRRYLQTIYVQIMSREDTLNALKSSDTIIEYILRIIFLKNNNQKLLRYLSNKIAFELLSSRVVELLIASRKKLSHQTFESHLQKFEQELLEEFETVLIMKMVRQRTDSTSFVHE